MGELQHTQRLAAAHVIAHWIEISPSCASRPLTMACHAMGTSHHQPILAAASIGAQVGTNWATNNPRQIQSQCGHAHARCSSRR
jgi:hypothetical protein